jgi:hypothetical protein
MNVNGLCKIALCINWSAPFDYAYYFFENMLNRNMAVHLVKLSEIDYNHLEKQSSKF